MPVIWLPVKLRKGIKDWYSPEPAISTAINWDKPEFWSYSNIASLFSPLINQYNLLVLSLAILPTQTQLEETKSSTGRY